MKISVDDICNTITKGKYKFVLISGNGAAGKSTFATKLQENLERNGKTVSIISTDDYLLDKTYRKNNFITYTDKNGDAKSAYLASTFPGAYDYESLNNAISIQDADIMVIEGIGAALIVNNFERAYKIFLQVDKETEYTRRIQRARSGADLSKERMDIRHEQFELFILPLSSKFDLRLTSMSDFSYSL